MEYISDEIFECVDCCIDDEMNNSQMPIQIWMNIMLRILEQILFCNEIIYYHEKYTEYANYFCCQGFKPYLDKLENKKRLYLYLLNAKNGDEMRSKVEYIDIFSSGCNSRELFVQDSIDFKNLSVEEQAEKIKGCSIELLECEQLNGIISWLDSVLTKIIEYNIKLKKCKNCGEYFIPFNRSDAIYCDGPAPKNPKKTCKEFASQNLSYEKLKSDPVRDLHRKVYQQKARRVERNENLKKYAIDFENFKSESKKKKKQMKQGTLTEKEYVEWLIQEKNKEVKVDGNGTQEG